MRRLAVRLFGTLANRMKKHFKFLKPELAAADMKIPLRVYLSLALFCSFLGFTLSLTFLLTLWILLGNQLFLFFSSFIPPTVSILTFSLFLLYPIHKKTSRIKDIENNFPFLLIHMSSLVGSGLPPHLVFKTVSTFEEYGEASREIKKIVRNMETFGMDLITSVREVARRTPSPQLKEFLLGFVSTVQAGGDVATFLKETGERTLFHWRMRRESFIRMLSTYAEMYVGVLIAAPLTIISILMMMAMIYSEIAGMNIVQVIQLAVYVLIPLLNVGFLLFLKSVEAEI